MTVLTALQVRAREMREARRNSLDPVERYLITLAAFHLNVTEEEAEESLIDSENYASVVKFNRYNSNGRVLCVHVQTSNIAEVAIDFALWLDLCSGRRLLFLIRHCFHSTCAHMHFWPDWDEPKSVSSFIIVMSFQVSNRTRTQHPCRCCKAGIRRVFGGIVYFTQKGPANGSFVNRSNEAPNSVAGFEVTRDDGVSRLSETFLTDGIYAAFFHSFCHLLPPKLD
ncbi:unnamed protein product [Protopolystoma xenopodis]|uniref:Uncharacterized protein n=1 Tax=Protopolystoma xenopodis TaxID=117903 RepID=A0A3S5BUB6_9PLAT|nr:unnamed protein product [Protopolystoma xenopodis]